jgi:hypothetical protein
MRTHRFLGRAAASLVVVAFSLGVVAPVAAAADATATSIEASPTSPVRGQPVTVTAAVTDTINSASVPTGMVSFLDNGTAIGSVTVDGMGRAMLTTPTLATGMHSIVAAFVSGDATLFTDSTSGPATVTVVRAGTTTTLIISPNPVAPGETLTVDAVVDVTPPGAVDPFGVLQFTVDGTPIGDPLPLGSGTVGWEVTLIAPPLPGTYLVGATYSGDPDTEPSSGSLPLTITAPPSPNPPTVPPAPPAPQPLTTAPAAPATLSVSRLNAMTSPLMAALRARGLAALASTVQTLTAPGPGVLDQKVYSPTAPTTARAAATKKSALIASASHRFAAAGKGSLRLKLTAAGRKAARAGKSTKIAIVTRFKPSAGQAVVTTRRLTVKARRH